jgi:endonuclease/exonuclease/phosphatase family metal-dependent hydrolase
MEGRLRVMTYNVRNGRGLDGRVDLGRIGAVIASYGPDVVALQEVDRARPRSGTVDQAAVLAADLGMAFAFLPCLEVGEERYGLATLTRWPLLGTREVRLPSARTGPRASQPRCALVTRVASVPPGDGVVGIVNTHLSLHRDERVAQVAALASSLEADDVVVVGDLNCTARSAPFRRLSAALRPATAGVRSWPAALPVLGLDHIFYGGALELVGAGPWARAAARWASDHLPVVAELRLPARAQAA